MAWAEGEKKSILVVENDALWADIARTRLSTKYGRTTEVVVANGPGAAVKVLESKKYDLIVMDSSLVSDGLDIEGISLTEYIRKGGLNQTTPIVGWSENSGNKSPFMEAGANSFATKLTTPKGGLENAVDQAVGKYATLSHAG